MRIGIGVGEMTAPVGLDETIDEVRAAAAWGLDAVWSAQLPHGADALTTLAVAGHQVPGIGLGTAVVPTYPRHPLMLASQALTVQAATGNRLTLGVGPSHRAIIEDMLGYAYDRPARHTREYLEALLPLLRGETVRYAGETVRVNGAVRVAGVEPPRVMLSALGPVMLRLAGELTGGTILANTGIRAIAEHVVPTITRAAAAAGRPAPRVAAAMMLSVSAEPEARRRWVSEAFGPSVNQTPAYRAMLEREGVSDIGAIAITGDEETVAGDLARLAEAGATDLIAIPFGPAEDQARTTGLLADLARAARPVAA